MPERDQGFNPDRFVVIPRTLIFIFDGDRVLLLKGADDKNIWANKYNGIGGHVEAGEDVLGSAIRELEEETGITNIPLRLCGQVMVSLKHHQGIALFIFTGSYERETLKPSTEGDLEWVAVGQLENYPVVEDLPVLLEHVKKHQLGGPIFYGKYHYDEAGKLIMSFR